MNKNKLPEKRETFLFATITKPINKWNDILQRDEKSCCAHIAIHSSGGLQLPYIYYKQIFLGETCKEDAILWVRREFKVEPEVLIF